MKLIHNNLKKAFLAFTFQILGILIFLWGFLLIKKECHILNHEHSKVPLDKKLSRLILIIIDGLRYDYARKYLIQTLNFSNSSIFFETYSDPPTVTLQRLKAITTGSLPTFIEITNNFDTSSLVKTDSLLYQFKNSNCFNNITVIGDDTWVTLFDLYIDSKITFPSFDIYDIDGVDNVIFKTLAPNIIAHNSSLIIAHFLGVDHSAHVFSYSHPRVHQKITQIDSFLFSILNILSSDDLFVLLSDHGMTDSGSHGGASSQETSSFLFAFSPSLNFSKKTSKTFKNSSNLSYKKKVINQIDICPTISLLFNLPIPACNVGKIIPAFFEGNEKMKAYYQNAQQIKTLLHYYQYNQSNSNNNSQLFNISHQRIQKQYIHDAYSLFKKKFATFDERLMVIGLLFLLLSLFFLPLPKSLFPPLHSLSMFSDSFLFGENLVTQYFLTFSGLSYLMHKSYENMSNNALFKILFTIVLARLNGLFGHCREDSHRRICQPQLFNVNNQYLKHFLLNILNFLSKIPILSNFLILLGKYYIIPFILHCLLCYFNQENTEIEYFLSFTGFFSTGHQFTFSELNIESGYSFSKHFNFILSSFSIFLNTFLPHLLACLFAKDILLFYTYQSYSLICICGFAFYGRHHLMIWQLIAPRFLYQCIYTLLSFLFVLKLKFSKV